ncbi:Uncharacterised protein [Mycobacteroides abscessus subsp. abscessus]|nr:Uncharacterised protein [Mycobacteroides abscessus subsp. abscessus]
MLPTYSCSDFSSGTRGGAKASQSPGVSEPSIATIRTAVAASGISERAKRRLRQDGAGPRS